MMFAPTRTMFLIAIVFLLWAFPAHCLSDERLVPDHIVAAEDVLAMMQAQIESIHSFHCTVTLDITTPDESGTEMDWKRMYEIWCDGASERGRMILSENGEVTHVWINVPRKGAASWFKTSSAVRQSFALSVYDAVSGGMSDHSGTTPHHPQYIPDIRHLGHHAWHTAGLPALTFPCLRPKFLLNRKYRIVKDGRSQTPVSSIFEIHSPAELAEEIAGAGTTMTAMGQLAGLRFVPETILLQGGGFMQSVTTQYAIHDGDVLFVPHRCQFEVANSGHRCKESSVAEFHSVNQPIAEEVFSLVHGVDIPEGTLVHWPSKQPKPFDSDIILFKGGELVPGSSAEISSGVTVEPNVGSARKFFLIAINLAIAALAVLWWSFRSRKVS